MNTTLPRSVTVDGRDRAIEYKWGAAMDIMTALDNPEYAQRDNLFVALYVFYRDFDDLAPPQYPEALERLTWFLNGGQEVVPGTVSERLIDWEQDFPLIVAAINRVLGLDIREHPELHWWTVLSAFLEIGDCTLAQVVAIRYKQAKKQTLEKYEREWYRRNKNLVDLKRKYTRAEMELISKLI